jgi:hypothetical protein
MINPVYAIKHCDGDKDNRYEIRKEYCGYAEKRYVLRFCGMFIMQSINYQDCVEAGYEHKEKRMKDYV